ncbi:hypothetical protein ACFX12_030539 [Malus domestica]
MCSFRDVIHGNTKVVHKANHSSPSLAHAIIHYTTINVTPQRTMKEVSVSAAVLSQKSPCNFLVFGLGFDNLIWTALNHGGRTIFLEEDNSWIDQIKQKLPGLEAYHVEYDTKVHKADKLMEMGRKEECRAVEDPRFTFFTAGVHQLVFKQQKREK